MALKSQPVHGAGDRRWFFDCGQYWSEWFQSCNWYNFSLINSAFELDRLTGRVVVDVALLGFYGKVTYIYDLTFNDEIMTLRYQVNAVMEAEHPGCEIKDPLGLLDKLNDNQEK